MKLIDRYVHAVTQYLPEVTREDVGKELRSNIEDMLSDDASEEEVYEVLKKLGNPWRLANEYNGKKRYLIGPGYYDQYLITLKLVIGICISVFVVLAAIAGGVDFVKDTGGAQAYSNLVSKVMSAIFEGALQGAFWVTLVFVILERSGVEGGHPFSKKEWTPEDLPELPLPKHRLISKTEIIVSMCFTVIFTAILYFQPGFIAIIKTIGPGNREITPLFHIDRLQVMMPWIILLAVMQVGILIWKYIRGSWDITLAIGNTIYNLFSCIVLVVLVTDQTIFNQEFFRAIARYTNSTNSNVELWKARGILIFIIVLIIICVWESVSGFLKCMNKNKKVK